MPNKAENKHWLVADLLNPKSIEKVLSSGCTVINPAYSGESNAKAVRELFLCEVISIVRETL